MKYNLVWIFGITLFTLITINVFLSENAYQEISPHILEYPLQSNLDASSMYFNTQFLMNYNLVAQTLIEQEGFIEVNFLTSDKVTINGLWRFKPSASYTIIFCAGFYPGRKEGLATFVKMVPDNCNILFFDARGHGKSTGKFFSNIANYGIHEYKDIIAAIQFVHDHSNTPLILHGVCAGAFHAARALAVLETTGLEKYHIKGFVFDSGITSIVKVAHVPQHYFKEKTIPHLISSFYTHDTKQEIKERTLYKMSSSIICSFMSGLTYLIKPFLNKHDAKTNVCNSITSISCPIFFIHSQDDAYASFEEVKMLSEKTKSTYCWWIEQSEHALHHLKHKQEYAKRLNEFINASFTLFS